MIENMQQDPHTSGSVIHCADCRDCGALSIRYLLGNNYKFWKLVHRSQCFKRHQHLIFTSIRGFFWFWMLASVFITIGLPVVSAQGYDTIPRPCSKDSQRFCSRCENTTRSIRWIYSFHSLHNWCECLTVQFMAKPWTKWSFSWHCRPFMDNFPSALEQARCASVCPFPVGKAFFHDLRVWNIFLRSSSRPEFSSSSRFIWTFQTRTYSHIDW